ncbi:DUF423 domain-containing protein [Flavobacterium sp.]|uniref:DUF423 domain-containing protein n=1 Tax=Flavobacterium sp. TaxID=239 RepID=UPI0008D4D522|nr:DUF423 domain-containing protein [Flavobacterium sp.]OGS64705.1 MAG: hypothetical protein A2X21_07380 [Flavobacteria bacterium GWA2_35_26]HCF03950.1 DUF423 domain-containing protein [Flavobacterium sp.]
MDKKISITGAWIGMVAIILGAFGAHALKKVLTPEQLISFETGVRYQMYQAFFLFFLATQNDILEKTKKTIFTLILSGTFFFSGSIYLLSTMGITGVNFKPIGFITPIGGLLLIIAWGMLGYSIIQSRK